MKLGSYHPLISLLYFTGALGGTILFRHPFFLMISLTGAIFMLLTLYGRRAGKRLGISILVGLLYTVWYYSFHHFGITVLTWNFIGNAVTLESLLYSLVLGGTLTAVLLWCMVLHRVMTSDMLVYLAGKISPAFGLFVTRALRMAPRTGTKAGHMRSARGGIGADTSMQKRLRSRLREWSMLMTWNSENLLEAGDSMRSRGYGAGRRTAYAFYRFERKDRERILMQAGLLILLLVGFFLDQMQVFYDPVIRMNPVTAVTGLFYLAYAVFLLWPVGEEFIS